MTVFCELVMLIDIPTRGLNFQVGNYVMGVSMTYCEAVRLKFLTGNGRVAPSKLTCVLIVELLGLALMEKKCFMLLG